MPGNQKAPILVLINTSQQSLYMTVNLTCLPPLSPSPYSAMVSDSCVSFFSRNRSREQHGPFETRILWKVDIRVLPPLALVWLANFIDRSNVRNARIAGLEADTHLRGNQFNIALAVNMTSYMLVEMPSNWVIKRIGPSRWIPLLVFSFGVVTILFGFVQSYHGLVAVRFFLGLCEGGILAGIMLYLSALYQRHELQLRVGIFYASASLSGAFGGKSSLLATVIDKMDGTRNLAGWRWIFILEGMATCLIGVLAAILLPASLANAKFLTEEERAFAVQRLGFDDQLTIPLSVASVQPPLDPAESDKATTSIIEVQKTSPVLHWQSYHQDEEQFEWNEVVRGLLDVQTWLTGVSYLGIIVSLYSFSLFLPTIVAGLGYTGGQAQLHTVPPYVPAVILTVVVAFFADRYKMRGPLILAILPLNIAGYIMAIAAKSNEVRYAAVFIRQGCEYPTAPCILSILPNNTGGHYKKATCIALQLAIAGVGGFPATFVYTRDQAPEYVKGHSIVLAFVCMAWLFMCANVYYCRWENRERAAGRRQCNV
ncbi:MFS transporter, partial [Amylostereum chailletii]